MSGVGHDVPFQDVVTSVERLRTQYREPLQYVAEKKMPTIVPWARAVVEASPFVMIATANAEGHPTVSPKGGAPGFVTVLDERRLAIPDYPGNNLIDGLRNLVENQRIGLIFLIPGRGETLRVDGTAWITTQPEVLDACTGEGRRPKTAIGVLVDEVFIHCPSAFNRASLWKPEDWRDDAGESFIQFIRNTLADDELPDWARPGAVDEDDEDEATDEIADDED